MAQQQQLAQVQVIYKSNKNHQLSCDQKGATVTLPATILRPCSTLLETLTEARHVIARWCLPVSAWWFAIKVSASSCDFGSYCECCLSDVIAWNLGGLGKQPWGITVCLMKVLSCSEPLVGIWGFSCKWEVLCQRILEREREACRGGRSDFEICSFVFSKFL